MVLRLLCKLQHSANYQYLLAWLSFYHHYDTMSIAFSMSILDDVEEEDGGDEVSCVLVI